MGKAEESETGRTLATRTGGGVWRFTRKRC